MYYTCKNTTHTFMQIDNAPCVEYSLCRTDFSQPIRSMPGADHQWDSHSALLDPKTKHIVALVGSLQLLGAEIELAILDQLKVHNAEMLVNGAPTTREWMRRLAQGVLLRLPSPLRALVELH